MERMIREMIAIYPKRFIYMLLWTGERKDLVVFESSCHIPFCLSHTVETLQCFFYSRESVNSNYFKCFLFLPKCELNPSLTFQ